MIKMSESSNNKPVQVSAFRHMSNVIANTSKDYQVIFRTYFPSFNSLKTSFHYHLACTL